jgi:hypothetical protein
MCRNVTLPQVKMCTRSTPHNWKLCPWAHPGEAAARRHPSCHQADLCHAVRMVSSSVALSCPLPGSAALKCGCTHVTSPPGWPLPRCSHGERTSRFLPFSCFKLNLWLHVHQDGAAGGQLVTLRCKCTLATHTPAATRLTSAMLCAW